MCETYAGTGGGMSPRLLRLNRASRADSSEFIVRLLSSLGWTRTAVPVIDVVMQAFLARRRMFETRGRQAVMQ